MSNIVGRAVGVGGPSSNKLEFSYTGNYNYRDDGVLELLSSGILTMKKAIEVDAFLVGGGAAGTPGTFSNGGKGGGGGGYTKTLQGRLLEKGIGYQVVIGDGGKGGLSSNSDTAALGGSTTFLGETVEGGKVKLSSIGDAVGGNGGSGGGGGTYKASGRGGGYGGSNGSNGETVGTDTGTAGGTGQGTTTREFGESTGKLYSGGGGGGSYASYVGGLGGEGGGGKGAQGYSDQAGSGAPNTGGGGGGAAFWENQSASSYKYSGAGGSGIVCIRPRKQ